MANDLAAPGKKLAKIGITVQASVGIVATSLTGIYDLNMSGSVILGVIAFLLPHSVFAYWVFRYAGATKNNIVAQSMNQGMKLKLLLTFFIFVIAFSQLNAHPVFLLSAYVITMASQWVAMFIFSRNI
jgi:ATP synthase protein I